MEENEKKEIKQKRKRKEKRWRKRRERQKIKGGKRKDKLQERKNWKREKRKAGESEREAVFLIWSSGMTDINGFCVSLHGEWGSEGSSYRADQMFRWSDGGFGEGNPEAMASAHVVVVEVDEGLNGLFHSRHLQQRHLTVSEIKTNKTKRSDEQQDSALLIITRTHYVRVTQRKGALWPITGKRLWERDSRTKSTLLAFIIVFYIKLLHNIMTQEQAIN